MTTNFEIYNFAYENSPVIRNWRYKPFIEWFLFQLKNNRASIAKNNGKICGLAVARPISEPAKAIDRYYEDESGEIIYVDMTIVKNSSTKEFLLNELKQKIGTRMYIAFRRGEKSDSIRLHKLERFFEKWIKYGFTRTTATS